MKLKPLFLILTLLASLSVHAYDFKAINDDGVTIYYNIISSTEPLQVGVTHQGDDYSTGTPYSGDVKIPETVSYSGQIYSVTSIIGYSFRQCSKLTSVNIPESVTTIEEHAFFDCSSLKSITIPNSVTTIGTGNFTNCPNLSSFYGKFASEDNRCLIIDGTLISFAPAGITSYIIPNSVNTIAISVFSHCTNLTTITLPETVTNIASSAFNSCTGLTSITIPESVSSIGEYAFYGCVGLKTVNFNATNCTKMAGIRSDDTYYPVFEGCNNLKTLSIGNNVQEIPQIAFAKCNGITSVTIPESVTIIGNKAFYGCTKLATVTNYSDLDIVKGATTHGYVAYYANEVINGTQPESITLNKTSLDLKSGESDTLVATVLPEGSTYDIVWTSSDEVVATVDNDGKVTALGVGSATITATCGSVSATCSVTTSILESFSAVNADGVTIYYKITSSTAPYTVEVTYKDTSYNSYSGSVNIPESVTKYGITYSVTSVGTKAFYLSSGLTSITIPNSITKIGESAFTGCSGLTSVIIPESITTIGESAFNDCTGLITLNYNATNCTSMGHTFHSIFYGCYALTTLNIGENVQSIPNLAFYGCKSLTSVTIPDGVTSIGNYAFQYCSGLTSVEISESVISIGEYAFEGCSSLATLTIPNSITSIGIVAFRNCTSLTTVNYNASNCAKMGSYDGVVFSGCSNLAILYIGENVQTIPEYAFRNCTGLTSVTIPEGVTSIGMRAFNACTGLTTINYRAINCTDMKAYVFLDCSNVTTLNIGENVKTIPNSAFSSCSGLTSVEIPESVTSIGNAVFYNCSSLTSVSIGKSVTSIGNFAFGYCKSLISINIPKSVTSIGDNTFYGCSALSILPIHDNIISIGKSAFQYCNSLTTIDIPESVTSIGEYAFFSCSNLNTVNYNAINCSQMGSNSSPVFYLCSNLSTVNVGENVQSIPDNAFYSCTALATVTNYSFLDIVKGATTHGYVAYYADEVINIADSITFNKTNLNLKLGETEVLVATVMPKKSSYNIEWSSSNDAVATVDANGKITAVSKGSATITATCGTVSATCEVTVEYSEATDIIVTPGSGLDDIFENGLTLKDGESKKIDLTVVPATASPEFVWTSSDDSVVKIDENGNITAVGVGTATVTVSSGGFSKTFTVTVEPIPAESVTLNKTSVTLKAGDTETLVATVLPENTTDKTVTWTSYNESIVTVDKNGKLTTVAVGSTTITATCGSVYATCSVTVTPVEAETVILNNSTLSMKIGESQTLVASVLPDNTTDPTVTWTSSDKAVATVDSEGKVNGVAVGEATITATCGNVSATCVVTVNPVLPESVTLNKTSFELLVGASETLTATVLPDNTTYKTVVWASDDEDIATVDENGCVTGVGVGTVLIRATCGDIVGLCEVIVKPIPAESVMLDKTILKLEEGEFATLEATVLPEETTFKTITWISSDVNVAMVNEFGRILAVSVGTATITATCGDASATCEVYVIKEAGIDDLFIDEDGREVEVYDIHGIKVTTKNVAPGVYIRRVGNTVEKVLIK